MAIKVKYYFLTGSVCVVDDDGDDKNDEFY